MDISKENQLSELVIRHLQGENSPQELQQLKELLNDDAEAVELYVEYMMQFSALSQPGNITIEDFPETPSPSMLDTSLWTALSKYEKEAPAIEIPVEKLPRELIQKVVYPPKERRKLSTFSKVFLSMNAAAILFFVLFVRFAPPKDGVEVATLLDSINAKWADASLSMQSGTRLRSDKTPLLLREGLVKIKFDNNAHVTFEGPAEFQIFDDDMIKLNYGKVYSQVSPEAYGFQISTRYARIIDLGTEFGVKEDIDGDTEVHVLKGQVNLITNISGKKINIDLLAGSARAFNAQTGDLKEIPCKVNLFARRIDSNTNLVWQGQDTLDLADMVGGGNGLGTGKQSLALTLNDVMITSDAPVKAVQNAQSVNYKIPSSPFIDSLFIPKGKTHICSKEEIVAEFPNTSGITFGCVANKGIIAEPGEGWDNTLLLGGKEYGTPGAGMIHIHSNLGITFDLNQIRQHIPGLKIVGFSSLCGITETAQQMPGYNSAVHSWVDFWVLVDGVIRFKKEHVSLTSGPVPIDIALEETDRYLSLAVTDSDGSILYDWSIFARPQLTIIPAEK